LLVQNGVRKKCYETTANYLCDYAFEIKKVCVSWNIFVCNGFTYHFKYNRRFMCICYFFCLLLQSDTFIIYLFFLFIDIVILDHQELFCIIAREGHRLITLLHPPSLIILSVRSYGFFFMYKTNGCSFSMRVLSKEFSTISHLIVLLVN
jgi:hypothetical protein